MKVARFGLLLGLALFVASTANGGPLSTVFEELFDDAVLVPQLTNRNGTPISVGIADLNGSNPNGSAQGFTFDKTAWDSGSGPTVSWVMEAIIGDATTATSYDTFMSFNGTILIRDRKDLTGSPWVLYGQGVGATVATFAPPSNGDHVGFVFTENGAADTIECYVNEVLVATLSGSAALNQSATDAGFGLEVHNGAPISRGFDGSLDAVAFSTFTGAFEGDFALLASSDVPEPATVALLVFGLIGVAVRRRR